MRRLALFALLTSLSALTACRPSPSATVSEGPTMEVAVTHARSESRMSVLPLAGRIYNPHRANLVARVAGSIESSALRYGEAFAEGEEIVRLDAPEVAARLHQAQARLAQAERDWAREERLQSQGVTPAETVLALAEQRTLAAAAVREAQAFVAHTVVRAPFAGRIVAQHVQPGDTVMPGQPLATLEGEGARLIELSLPLSLPAPSLGTAVTVRWQQRELVTTLVEVAPGSDTGSSSRRVRLELPADFLYPSGEYVEVLWPRGESSALVLPAAAIRSEGEIDTVLIVKDQRLHSRLVRTVARTETSVEILSGLSPTDAVVFPVSQGLREGQSVTLLP